MFERERTQKRSTKPAVLKTESPKESKELEKDTTSACEVSNKAKDTQEVTTNNLKEPQENVSNDGVAVVKYMTPLQIEKTLRLASDIKLATKEVEIVEFRAREFDYEEKLLSKESALVNRLIEISRLKKALVMREKQDMDARVGNHRSTYNEHAKGLSTELGMNFGKCAFDPETGLVKEV